MSIEHDKAVLREALDNFFVTRPLGEDHEPIPVARIALTCTLYFKNAHLPEVQHNVCECVRDFVSLIGEETKFCITADTSRCTLAKKRKLRIMDESMLHKIQEKGNKPSVRFLVASHDSMDEFNTMPPKFSLMTRLQIGMGDDAKDTIPLDKKVSYFSAVFAPSFFLLDKQPLTFTDLVLKWCNALRPLSGAAGWGVSQPSEEWRFLYAESLCAQELIQYPGLDKPLRPLLRDDLPLLLIAAFLHPGAEHGIQHAHPGHIDAGIITHQALCLPAQRDGHGLTCPAVTKAAFKLRRRQRDICLAKPQRIMRKRKARMGECRAQRAHLLLARSQKLTHRIVERHAAPAQIAQRALNEHRGIP